MQVKEIKHILPNSETNKIYFQQLFIKQCGLPHKTNSLPNNRKGRIRKYNKPEEFKQRIFIKQQINFKISFL